MLVAASSNSSSFGRGAIQGHLICWNQSVYSCRIKPSYQFIFWGRFSVLSLCLFFVLVHLSVSLPCTSLPAVSVRACVRAPIDLCCWYKRGNSKVPHAVFIVIQEEWAVLLPELGAGLLQASGRLSCAALSFSKGAVMRLHAKVLVVVWVSVLARQILRKSLKMVPSYTRSPSICRTVLSGMEPACFV